MKLQVILSSCLLVFGTVIAGPQRSENDSDDLKQLLNEFSDTTARRDALIEKFEKVHATECAQPENEAVCKSIQAQMKALTGHTAQEEEQMDKEINVLNSILSSIHEKVEKLDRKMESGVSNSISARDYINAMKGLERKLQSFQMSVMNVGKELRIPAKYVVTEDDDEDVDGIKHLGKTCKLLIGPYKKLLKNIDRMEDMIKSRSDGAVCSMNLQRSGDKLKDIKSMLKDISDDIRSLAKMGRREIEENEKILKKILYKLKEEISDDDKDDKALEKSLKSFVVKQRRKLEVFITQTVSKLDKDKDSDDDCDDSDECKKDTDTDDGDDDETDNSCNDSDGCDRKKDGKDDTDDDDDDDDDDTDDTDDDKKSKRKDSKNDTDDSDDFDDDDDDDTDTDDDDDKKGKGKKKSKKFSEDMSHKDVEVFRNSASAGPYGRHKFLAPLLGIPRYIEH